MIRIHCLGELQRDVDGSGQSLKKAIKILKKIEFEKLYAIAHLIDGEEVLLFTISL